MKNRDPLHPREHGSFVAGALLAFAAVPVVAIGIWAAVAIAKDTPEPQANVFNLLHFVSVREKPQVVKGVYIASLTAGSAERRGEIFDMIDRTELNAVVIDIKTADGAIAYDTGVGIARDAGLVTPRPYDISEILSDARRRDIWTIARFPVFEDPRLVAARPDMALKTKGGGFWVTRRGTAWLDPTNREVWQYAADLANDALGRGFDEVQFDYIRFPSDGDLSDMVFADPGINDGTKPKHVVMAEFYAYLRSEVGEDAVLSADLFGLTMDASASETNDLRIGQRMRDAHPQFSVISPMVYPSHYPPFYDGIQRPAAVPGEIIRATFDSSKGFFGEDFGKIRPWLQDFNLGAIYTPEMVRAQIDAAESFGVEGWLLWDPRNTYTEAALKPAQ